MEKIRNARAILREDGPSKLIHSAIWFVWCSSIRPLMPVKDESTDVVIDEVKFHNAPNDRVVSRFGDGLMKWRPVTLGQNGEVNAHRRYTKEGDHVCIIGGGNGVTTVHSARQVGPEGSVTVFEGGRIASRVREVAQLNEVDEVVSVEEAIVGEHKNVYQGMIDEAEVIDPADLPACDVLEMDCEGSELSILEGMQVRPRVLIVELHPSTYAVPNKTAIELIEEMGYELVYFSTQSGIPIPKNEFLKLPDNSGDVLAAVQE